MKRKMFKTPGIIAAAVILTLSFASCETMNGLFSKEPAKQLSIVGQWRAGYTGSAGGRAISWQLIFTFNEDGTGDYLYTQMVSMVAREPQAATFTYTLKGTTLNYKTDTGENVKATVKLEDNKLTLTASGNSKIVGSQEMVLTLVEGEL